MSNTRIQTILMGEIELVNKNTDMSHHDKAYCFNKLVNVYNRTSTTTLRAIAINDKLVNVVPGDISRTLKRPELK